MSTGVPIQTRAQAIPRAEIVRFADELAANARLNDPLPQNVDFSDGELKELQTQMRATTMLPRDALEAIYFAFSAKYLPQLATALRNVSRETQRKATSAYIQIFSLLPDPKYNPYLRKFLMSSTLSKGLPTLIANAFWKGIEWLKPSGPGHLCTLIIHTLFWCDASMGNDKNGSIDKAVRDGVAQKLAALQANESFGSLEELQRVEIERLAGILSTMDNLGGPPGYFLTSTRNHILGSIPGQEECDVCMDEEAEMQCSSCKSVRYCSKKCQTKAWKDGHKLRCFVPAF